ncbi:hypothetical protein [Streptomyces lonarensis]|uniref:Uncharacterized protein n=1 Tax=Streptomyces lonarensis TaxID=700599 RepID=A0A7X6CXA3_9ACTN|nr:hypothetical protein [Streptomyces lonarensis]NJQ04099.1 hypothetical protein [Streptomyces lonarensis]
MAAAARDVQPALARRRRRSAGSSRYAGRRACRGPPLFLPLGEEFGTSPLQVVGRLGERGVVRVRLDVPGEQRDGVLQAIAGSTEVDEDGSSGGVPFAEGGSALTFPRLAFTLGGGLLATLRLGEACLLCGFPLVLGVTLRLHEVGEGLLRVEAEPGHQVPHAGAALLVLLPGEQAGQFVLGDADRCSASAFAPAPPAGPLLGSSADAPRIG